MNNNIKSIMSDMKKNNIDVAFFSDPSTIHLMTGYLSEPHERILAFMIFKDATPILFTPALEIEDAKATVSNIQVESYLDTQNPWEIIQTLIISKGILHSNWAIEKQHLTVQKLEALQKFFPRGCFTFDYSPFMANLRIRKSADEIEKMKKAGYWADEAIKIGALALHAGVSELEIVAEIEYQLKKRGISQMSFDTMVLFGDNAANPHGTPGERKLKTNEFVLFDLGVVYEGYTSDVTRTLFFGDAPSEQQEKVYNLVLDAHDAAMAKATLDMSASNLDGIARNIIADQGYGTYFNHRLGHGLGQSVHEFPSIMEGNEMPLVKNMCFSIEPGIYIPNEVGVRIEDCGYLDEHGFHSFTFFPTHLTAYTDFMKS